MEGSKTHFGFTNMGSEMRIFRVIAIWNSKFWFGSPCMRNFRLPKLFQIQIMSSFNFQVMTNTTLANFESPKSKSLLHQMTDVLICVLFKFDFWQGMYSLVTLYISSHVIEKQPYLIRILKPCVNEKWPNLKTHQLLQRQE